MDIPGLGIVTKDSRFGWYYSQPMSIPVLRGQTCRMVVEGYDDDPNKDEIHVAIANFLSLPPAALEEAALHVFRYFQNCNDGMWEPDDDEFLVIESPSEVWRHVRLGDEPMVSRRHYGDRGIYVSLSCGCDWEEEHGLQIVFKNGLRVNKVGPYDGHLTNSDAYADNSLEDVVYRAFG